MLKNLSRYFDNMALAFVLWLCLLPLIGLSIVPVFGFTAGALAAVALFVAAIVICWGICSWKLFDS